MTQLKPARRSPNQTVTWLQRPLRPLRHVCNYTKALPCNIFIVTANICSWYTSPFLFHSSLYMAPWFPVPRNIDLWSIRSSRYCTNKRQNSTHNFTHNNSKGLAWDLCSYFCLSAMHRHVLSGMALSLKGRGILVVPGIPSKLGMLSSSAGRMVKFWRTVVKARKSSFRARFSPMQTRLPETEEVCSSIHKVKYHI